MRHLPTCLLLHSPGVTGRSVTISPPSSPLSPTVLQALTASRGSFIHGGVKSDFPPGGLAWWLGPPVGTELMAGQLLADGEAVPSEVCAVPTWVASEFVGPDPLGPAPAVPKHAFL